MVAAATRVAGRPARGMDEVSSPPHPQPGGVADAGLIGCAGGPGQASKRAREIRRPAARGVAQGGTQSGLAERS